MEFNKSLYAIKGIVILDSDGNKLLTKYYCPNLQTSNSQTMLENELVETSKVAEGGISVFKNLIFLYKCLSDLTIVVIGGFDENELLLCEVLEVLCETLTIVLKPLLDKASLIRKYDKLILILDQMVENGIILSLNKDEIVSRASSGTMGIDLFTSDQPIFQYIQKAQEHIVSSLM